MSSKPASISPHDDRHRYRVKPTDVILAPNQPKIIKHVSAPNDEEDWEWDPPDEGGTATDTKVEDDEENSDLEDQIPPLPSVQQQQPNRSEKTQNIQEVPEPAIQIEDI